MYKTFPLLNICLVFAFLLAACGPAIEGEEQEHLIQPGVPVYAQQIFDCNTGKRLSGAVSIVEPEAGCDNWELNRYERPFIAETQDKYFPDLDILSASLGTDGTWFYAKLEIYGANEDNGFLAGTYAIEFDLDIDGRGDVLVLAKAPGEEASKDWTVAGVQFYGDGNNDVGNKVPLSPDSPNLSDGYDTLTFDEGEGDDPDQAWVRLDPGTPSVLELAFKADALYYSSTFKWWAWSDQGVANPGGADYHDTFAHEEAGDPIQGQAFFPTKLITELDNTCASIWGTQPGDDPDLCANDPVVPPPSQLPSVTPTASNTPLISTTPTKPITLISGTPTPSVTPTASETPCFVHTPQVGILADGTQTTGTPQILQPAQDTNTPMVIATCTPTPTVTASLTSTTTLTGTPCMEPNATFSVTCTPTPTSTYTLTATPTVCFIYNVAGQFIDCTPTPTATYTSTDCYIPYAFAVISCTPTPSASPTATGTLCIIPDNTGTYIQCTPTPLPTATPTVCVNGALTAALVLCTPTPVPTQCFGADVAGAQVPCTPTPETAAMMVYPDQNTNCRQGTSSSSQAYDTLMQGEGYIPVGRTPDNLYFLFRGPVTNVRCWAPTSLFTIPFGPLNLVPSEALPYINYPTATPTPSAGPKATATPLPQCSDGIDNDSDGNTDYPRDKNCASPSDNNESS
jgi:hypothetical protein